MRRAILLSLALAATARADVRLPAIFSDHMVIQRQTQVPIWGWAAPHEKVTVRAPWVNAQLEATADEAGRWRLALHTPDASGPFTITIAGTSTIQLSDVLIGEVWLCSGQSNMEWPLSSTHNGADEIKSADHPRIRLFNVENAVSAAERDDCKGQWSVCSPQSAGRFSAVAYYFARRLQADRDVPIGLIQADWGGTPAEAWTSAAGLSKFPEFAKALANIAGSNPTPHTPSALFNGMIAPIAGSAIRGAIWYQGESNCGRAYQYRTLFPAMIADWRARWGGTEFPFYYVQIAPYRYENDRGQAAELREAQVLALSTPGTGMAVTMDIGDPADIHPRNKRDVGQRLAIIALAKTYRKTGLECSGPLYRDRTIEGDRIRLRFDHASGLAAPAGSLRHFTIAGEDQQFTEASATIEGDSVVVSSPSVPQPVAVRYCWGAADEGMLVNGAGLPAPSFRTDTWKGVTQPE